MTHVSNQPSHLDECAERPSHSSRLMATAGQPKAGGHWESRRRGGKKILDKRVATAAGCGFIFGASVATKAEING